MVLKHLYILKKLEEASISVACSRWNEPFGRSSLEASSRGCAVIISDKGGLKETITNAIVIKELNYINIYKSIKSLIDNKKKLKDMQKRSLENFYLTDRYISRIIDEYRSAFIKIFSTIRKIKNYTYYKF